MYDIINNNYLAICTHSIKILFKYLSVILLFIIAINTLGFIGILGGVSNTKSSMIISSEYNYDTFINLRPDLKNALTNVLKPAIYHTTGKSYDIKKIKFIEYFPSFLLQPTIYGFSIDNENYILILSALEAKDIANLKSKTTQHTALVPKYIYLSKDFKLIIKKRSIPLSLLVNLSKIFARS